MRVIIDILAYIVLGGALSWFFYHFRKKDLLGGFTGGMVVGILGSVLGVLFVSQPVKWSINFLQNGLKITNVDILAGIIGGYGALYVYNKINHDRTRKEY
jgi:uncharacterized membrane protein YeaQ/YmgE (transglycosylase-associated protein family)